MCPTTPSQPKVKDILGGDYSQPECAKELYAALDWQCELFNGPTCTDLARTAQSVSTRESTDEDEVKPSNGIVPVGYVRIAEV